MKPYLIRKIIVPVDLSETSLNALETAVFLALKHNAELFILNVIEIVCNPADEYNQTLTERANLDVLTALTENIDHKHGLTPTLIQKRGYTTPVIIATSQIQNCDLIVMGTHGGSGFRDGFIGSNAYSVIKYSSCPVLTIPPGRKIAPFRKILFPIRPVKGALVHYKIACHFLSSNATLEILGLSYLTLERETDILDNLAEEIKEEVETNRVKVNKSWGTARSPADDILFFSNKINPELIVLTAVLDAFNKPDFIGPHSQKIINCSKTPVLVIKG